MIEPNSSKIERVAFTGDDRTICVRLSDDLGEKVLQAGLGCFQEGRAELSGFGFRYAANGVWHGPAELRIDHHFTELPFYNRIVCRFDGDNVHISSCRSVPVAPVLSDMALLSEMRGTRV